MASTNCLSNVSLRPATEADLNAILALLLTSFRQFPLFDFLYSPLNEDINFAKDTVFFWRRRLLLNLLDPDVSIIVAEAPAEILAASTNAVTDGEHNDPVFEKSVAAIEWTEQNGLRSVSPTNNGNTIVGWAIWSFRRGGKAKPDLPTQAKISCYNRLKASLISLEVVVWNKIYQRKDQEPARYAAYQAAEEELSKTSTKNRVFT